MSGGQQLAAREREADEHLALLDRHLVALIDVAYDPVFGAPTLQPLIDVLNERLGPLGMCLVEKGSE